MDQELATIKVIKSDAGLRLEWDGPGKADSAGCCIVIKDRAADTDACCALDRSAQTTSCCAS